MDAEKPRLETKPFIDVLTLKDAQELKSWWNANGDYAFGNYTIRKSPTNPRFWALYRSRVDRTQKSQNEI